MEIRLRCVRGPPSRIKARLRSPLDPKKIHSPHHRHLEPLNHTLRRQRQDRVPLFRRLIYIHPPAQTASQIVLFSWRNLQINPKSIWRYFNFLVTIRIRPARLQKNLANIAIPKPIPPSRRFRVLENSDVPVGCVKSHKQEFVIPQQPHLRFPLFIPILSLPIRMEANRRRRVPSALRRKSFRIHRASHPNRKRGIRSDIAHIVASDVRTPSRHSRKGVPIPLRYRVLPQFSRKLFAHAPLSRKKQGASHVLASNLPNFLFALDAPEVQEATAWLRR